MGISMRSNSPLNILSKIVVWAVLLLLQLPVATYADEIEEVVVIGEHCDAACRAANIAESMKMIRIENIMKSYRDASSYDLSIAMKGSCLNKATFVESECNKEKDMEINADFSACEAPENFILRVLINLAGWDEAIDEIDSACSFGSNIGKLRARGVCGKKSKELLAMCSD